jgi:diguanylate cyclase (GGDEF)-like protein
MTQRGRKRKARSQMAYNRVRMRIGQAAVFERNQLERARIAEGLAKAGLKVTSAEDADGLARERLVVIGSGVARPGKVARAVRRAVPDALVLASGRRPRKAPWADGLLPLPVSAADLRVRLPELVRLRGLSGGRAQAIRIRDHILDPLTGFYTFAHFKEVLFVEVKRARRYNFPLSLALVSFDPLPRKLGASFRSALFSGLAVAIRQSLRDTDYPVRYDADHVALLMPHTDLQGALSTSQRICEQVEKSRLEHPRGVIRPTVSIGVAGCPQPSREFSFAELVMAARDAMDRASAAGGNRVEFTLPELAEAETA